MKTYKITADERKAVAKRISELTGEPSVYTKMPRCAYEIGIFTVERDNTLTADEAEGMDVIRTLSEEGLIEADDFPDEAETADELDEAAGGEEATEDWAETEETGDDTEMGQEEPSALDLDGINIQLPLSQHTGTSLRNLINMIYSRGGLLSKATGGEFRVDGGLTDVLKDDGVAQSVDTLKRAIADYEDEHGKGIYGIEILTDRVSFTGFPAPEDSDHVQAFTQLAALMNQMAISQKRIQAKMVDESNERYAFRIWLLRLGMAGNEYKRTRNILMQPLSGNTAFKTEEEADRFKAKMKAKRAADKEEQNDGGEQEADNREEETR